MLRIFFSLSLSLICFLSLCLAAYYNVDLPPQRITTDLDDSDDGVSATTIREVALLKHMNHPNVVELKDTFFHRNEVYLVFECCKGDLKQYLNKFVRRSPLKMNKIKKFIYQILNGIGYCHSIGILHRDIKPQNILVNYATEEIRITDFGLSRTFVLPNRSWTHEVVTLWYRPPEVLMGCNKYSIGVDIWSIGCVLGEMLNNNRPLFCGQSEISQLLTIFKAMGTPNASSWPKVVAQCKEFCLKYPKWERKEMKDIVPRNDFDEVGQQLLDSMLLIDPIKRISCKEALNHPWFHRTT